MTTRSYNAVTNRYVVKLFASGHDEPARRANAIATFRELWPDAALIRLEPVGDW